MESGCSAEITNAGNHDPGKVTNPFIFTEQQINRQLVDMREQTDFMKKFRCVLGIALREIKTLRTTASLEHSRNEGEEFGSLDVAKDVPAKSEQGKLSSLKCHPSCSLPSTSTCSDYDLAGTSLSTSSDLNVSSAGSCFCDDNGDLAILKEYLSKMTFGDVASKQKSRNVSLDVKPDQRKNLGKLKDPGTLIENSIRHIERLKQYITNRNTTVVRLRQKLTQSRIIRVKREAKLEQKLKEMMEWKEKCEKAKKLNEKQTKISKGLRLALNAEKQKVKSSENVARGLEQTRRAFQSLKSQAGHLMALLSDKEKEIAQLTSKLEELENSKDPVTSHDIMTSPIHAVSGAQASGVDAEVQTDMIHCDACRKLKNEAQTWQTKYDRLFADFEGYRTRQSSIDASHQLLYSPVTNERGPPPQDHHYGRRRMHAPYTSPGSYGRVSRPPLRRRLIHELPSNRDRSNHKMSPYAVTNEPYPCPSDTLLSPIEENEEHIGQEGPNFIGKYSRGEAHEDDSVISSHESHDSAHDQETMSHGVHHEDISSSFNGLQASASSPDLGFQFAHEIPSSILHEQPVEMKMSPKHDSGISSAQKNEEYSLSTAQAISETKGTKSPAKSLTKSVRRPKSSDEFPLHKLYNHPCVPKTSYLEVGASKTPSPSSSVNAAREVEDHEESPLCVNSIIRYNESDDTVSEQSSLPHDDDELDFSKETNNVSSDIINPEQNAMTFGVMWHPAMAPFENDPQSQHPVWLATPVENGNFFDTSAPNPLLRPNDNINSHDVITNKRKKSGRQSSCVTYKGHKIDVTEFSIDAFRKIIWSLDGGPESADDFIKFLASLAKKLNANPKWDGKHSMGNPKDWLGLRGLY